MQPQCLILYCGTDGKNELNTRISRFRWSGSDSHLKAGFVIIIKILAFR